MIKIYFNPLDARSVEQFDVAPGTQLIDFLQLHYPTGFNGVLRVFVGTDELALDDLDYEVKETDAITMLVLPAGIEITWAAVGKILLQAAISAAIGLAISMIFRPSGPGSPKEESPVYSINATQNRSRLGEPIAAHYGTISYPPDYAAAPYIFYNEASNDMFVDEMLCLGQGNYTIDAIYIGETPIDDLEAGTVYHWVYGPADHEERLGVIEADTWDKIKDTPTPLPFRENVFTSPEVESWEFTDDREETATTDWAPISGTVVPRGIYAPTGQPLPGRIIGVPDTVVIRPGDTLTMQGTTSNNVSFVVDAVVPGDTPGLQTIFERYKDDILSAEDPLNAAAEYQVNYIPTDLKAGPFRAQKIGQIIDAAECDIVFPGGLYHVSSTGNIRWKEADLQLTFQQIDPDTGVAIGVPTVIDKNFRGAQREAYRATVQSGPLTPGAYEVTVERTDAVGDDDADQNTPVWAGLKGDVVLDTEAEAYGPVTMLVMRMRATNGLGQAARTRVRVTARRVLDSGESENPITVIKDIYTNTDYGMGRAVEEMNLAELDALEAEWSGVNGPRFNGSFDQRGTGWDAMQSTVSFTGSNVVQNNALVTVIPDRVQPVRAALFNTANMVRDTLEISYTFDTDGEFDGTRVEYNDPTNFDPQYAKYPEESVEPEAFTLFGCTDATYAEQFATYLWNVRANRRRMVKFQTELDGLIPRFGDRIGVSHSLPDWGESGVIVEQMGPLTWRVDRFLDWTGENYIVLRTDDGTPTDPIMVMRGDNDDMVVFQTDPPVTIYEAGERDPTLYSFGHYYELVKDFIVTKITPQGDTIIEIQGQLYDAAIYDGAPPHMGGNTPSNPGDDGMIEILTITDPVSGEFNFQDIPQGYRRLIIQGSIRSAAAAASDAVRPYINGDTTDANYHTQANYVLNGSAVLSEFTGATWAGSAPAATATVGSVMPVHAIIEDYTGANLKMLGFTLNTIMDTTQITSGSVSTIHKTETGPVTEFALTSDSGSGLIGTLTLYGEM